MIRVKDRPHSRTDKIFVTAHSSLKECRESGTRLRVCRTCQIGPQQEARALVQEGNELIAIVTTIIKNKRKNVAAKLTAGKAGRLARKATPPARGHEFQIPNS